MAGGGSITAVGGTPGKVKTARWEVTRIEGGEEDEKDEERTYEELEGTSVVTPVPPRAGKKQGRPAKSTKSKAAAGARAATGEAGKGTKPASAKRGEEKRRDGTQAEGVAAPPPGAAGPVKSTGKKRGRKPNAATALAAADEAGPETNTRKKRAAHAHQPLPSFPESTFTPSKLVTSLAGLVREVGIHQLKTLEHAYGGDTSCRKSIETMRKIAKELEAFTSQMDQEKDTYGAPVVLDLEDARAELDIVKGYLDTFEQEEKQWKRQQTLLEERIRKSQSTREESRQQQQQQQQDLDNRQGGVASIAGAQALQERAVAGGKGMGSSSIETNSSSSDAAVDKVGAVVGSLTKHTKDIRQRLGKCEKILAAANESKGALHDAFQNWKFREYPNVKNPRNAIRDIARAGSSRA